MVSEPFISLHLSLIIAATLSLSRALAPLASRTPSITFPILSSLSRIPPLTLCCLTPPPTAPVPPTMAWIWQATSSLTGTSGSVKSSAPMPPSSSLPRPAIARLDPTSPPVGTPPSCTNPQTARHTGLPSPRWPGGCWSIPPPVPFPRRRPQSPRRHRPRQCPCRCLPLHASRPSRCLLPRRPRHCRCRYLSLLAPHNLRLSLLRRCLSPPAPCSHLTSHDEALLSMPCTTFRCLSCHPSPTHDSHARRLCGQSVVPFPSRWRVCMASPFPSCPVAYVFPNTHHPGQSSSAVFVSSLLVFSPFSFSGQSLLFVCFGIPFSFCVTFLFVCLGPSPFSPSV
jgi:hypothetical protein